MPDGAAEVRAIQDDADGAWHEMLFNASVQDRLVGVGVLSRQAAISLGDRGSGRSGLGNGSGCADRRGRPFYTDFRPAALADPLGDVAARVQIRVLELRATSDLLCDLLQIGINPLRGDRGRTPGRATIGVARVESPRGETVLPGGRRREGLPVPPAHGLLRQLAGGGCGGPWQPPARLPAHQQEL